MRHWSWVLAALAGLGACSARSPRPPARDRIAIAVSERYERGTHLVAVDERGDRVLELVRGADSTVRDTHPAISPDGRWIVFSSSRDRPLDQTSLWIAPLQPDAVPVVLTLGDSIDSHPTWNRDGTAVVFASTRGGAGFDLYQLAVDGRGRAIGAPVALTVGPGHQVTPSVALEGTIVYGAVTPTAAGEVESHLEARLPDGAIAQLTQGPADTSPAVSPDGHAIAFARPVARQGGVDSDLWLASVGGQAARHLVDIPLTDESGPVWSRDGRFVFATSVLRGARGDAVFSAVIVVDTADATPVARVLFDRTGAVARLTPAVATAALDAVELGRNPEYLPEIARIAAAAIAAHKARQPSE